MTREQLEAFEEKNRIYKKEAFNKLPIPQEEFELLDNISSMHGAVIDGAKAEGYDLKDFYNKFFSQESTELIIYRAYVQESIAAMCNSKHPYRVLYDWFQQTMYAECYRKGLFNV